MGGDLPHVPAGTVPAVTEAQMREVDRLMIDVFHIDLPRMMENAGRSLAELTLRLFAPGSVTVLAGTGGNGGGGLVAARHLVNRGVAVSIVAADPDRLTPVPAAQLDILRRMGVAERDEPVDADVVIDALLGYSLRGDPRGRYADLIEWANRQPAPVVALDTPSGLDVTTGEPGTPCMQAAVTMTLALPKTGLIGPSQVGELYLADISVPSSLYEQMGISVPTLFREGQIIRLVTGQTT